jgi:type IV secretory pathway TrbD component
MTAGVILGILCMMLTGCIVAVGLTIWLIADILKEKHSKGDKDDSRNNG